MPLQPPAGFDRMLRWARVDFAPAHRQPSAFRLAVALAVAVVGSLAADALLVVAGTALFPATKGYVHFQFHDYAKLTIIGVAIACAGWPLVTTLTSQPRRLFLQAAIVITIVLFAPDAYIWHNGASGKAVFVLIWMHVAIAIVTYNALVHLAPVGRTRRRQRPQHSR